MRDLPSHLTFNNPFLLACGTLSLPISSTLWCAMFYFLTYSVSFFFPCPMWHFLLTVFIFHLTGISCPSCFFPSVLQPTLYFLPIPLALLGGDRAPLHGGCDPTVCVQMRERGHCHPQDSVCLMPKSALQTISCLGSPLLSTLALPRPHQDCFQTPEQRPWIPLVASVLASWLWHCALWLQECWFQGLFTSWPSWFCYSFLTEASLWLRRG